MREWQIDTVRGRMSDDLAAELLEFWAREAGFTGERAEARLDEVVCVLREGGRLAGVSSAYEADIPLVAGRRFWVFRSLLPGPAQEQWRAMIGATFTELDREHAVDVGPEGLCVLAGASERSRHPDAEWTDPRMIHAGYLDDGRQVRIGYFSTEVSSMSPPEARTAPPAARFPVMRFADQHEVGEAEVVDLWTREAGLPAAEAERRLGELLFVGLDGRRLAGISTVYLARHPQLGAELWHFRAFTPAAYRRTNVAVSLVIATRRYLEGRYLTGEDRRASGIVFEIENPELNRSLPRGIWFESDVLFVGETVRGSFVRVHWFPGAPTPDP